MKRLLLLVAFLSLAGTASAEPGAEGKYPGLLPGYPVWGELLSRHVTDGVVDYAGFKGNLPLLNGYLDQMAEVDPADLSREERFAFYINLYNAWTIRLILTEYPGVKSIKDIGGFFGPWKMDLVRLNGKVITLNDLEHDILRPEFKDPRVHFAINCASLGCPKLRSEPYVGARLGQQLDEAASLFLNDPEKTYLNGNKLYVSRIFKWFSEDFDKDPVSFVRRYAKGDLARRLQAAGDSVSLRYLSYDWSLNGR